MHKVTDQVTLRRYAKSDCERLALLWREVNRELAPPDMLDAFEAYVDQIVNSELRQLEQLFSDETGGQFWVVEHEGVIVGCFGIERVEDTTAELRRMYLNSKYRNQGLAPRMLQTAETEARNLGYCRMTLSTAEVQQAAIAFYKKSGYIITATKTANAMSNKTVGGGLTRLHFEKQLAPITIR